MSRIRFVDGMQQLFGNSATDDLLRTAQQSVAVQAQPRGASPKTSDAPAKSDEAKQPAAGGEEGLIGQVVGTATDLIKGVKKLYAEGARFVLGVLLPPDAARMRWQLGQLTAERGKSGLHEYYGRLTQYRSMRGQVGFMRREMAADDPRRPTEEEVAEAALEIKLIDLFEQEYLQFRNEIDATVDDFLVAAKGVTEDLLAEALRRVQAENARYGLPNDELIGDVDNDKVHMANAIRRMRLGSRPEVLQGLSAAGGRLATSLRTAAAATDAVIEANNHYAGFSAQPMEDQYGHWEAEQANAEHAADGYKSAVRAYYIERDAAEREYPILAEWSHDFGKIDDLEMGSFFGLDEVKPVPDEKLEALGQVGRGPSFAQFHAASKAIDRQHDISEFRDRVNDDSDVIWNFDTLVELTMQSRGIAPGSWQARVITDHARHVVRREKLISMGLSILSFALGFVAIPFTGGASAIGMGAAAAGAGVAGYSFHRQMQEYRLKKAASGTDFDKARAIAAEVPDEPSMFWLALDIAGFGFDFAVAAKKFTTIVQYRRAYRAALAADDARMIESSERALVNAGDEFGAGKRLVEDARKEQGLAGPGKTPPGGIPTVPAGTYVTWTQQQALDVFTRTFRRPGPGPDNYRVYSTIEDYAKAINRPLTDLPGGLYLNNVVHIPPGAPVNIVMHESLHWISEWEHASDYAGVFLTEGLTDWTTIRHFYEYTDRAGYVANMNLADEIAKVVGADFLERVYVQGHWADLKIALEPHLGGPDQVTEFFRLLKKVDQHGEPPGPLIKAWYMLRKGSKKSP